MIICGQHLVANTPLPEEIAGLPLTRLPLSEDTVDQIRQKVLCDVLREFGANLALVLGDRFELLSVAECCTFSLYPDCPLLGGKERWGHSMIRYGTRCRSLSQLHLVSHELAANRLASLQEEPWRIAVTGDPGLDTLLLEKRLSPAELKDLLGVRPSRKDVVIALHPVTRAPEETADFLDAVSSFCESFEDRVFLSTPNGDPGSNSIEQKWRELSSRLSGCLMVKSLGAKVFRSLVAACGALVGNSSSGVWEAPTLGTPSLDLGSRQHWRVRGESVVHCMMGHQREVVETIRHLLSPEGQARVMEARNPYGDGHATPRILEHIWRGFHDPRLMVKN